MLIWELAHWQKFPVNFPPTFKFCISKLELCHKNDYIKIQGYSVTKKALPKLIFYEKNHKKKNIKIWILFITEWSNSLLLKDTYASVPVLK